MKSGEKQTNGAVSEQKYKQLWDELYDEAILIPNMTQDGVPRGSEDQAKIVAEWGEKREDECLTAEKLVQTWRSLLHPTDASGQLRENSEFFLGKIA